jgi:hypothetical protein
MNNDKNRIGEVRYKGTICINPPIWRIKDNNVNTAVIEKTILSILHSSAKNDYLFHLYAVVCKFMNGI